MKQILITLTLLMPALAFGQYPASPTTKVDLGRQTTGDGLTFRTSGAPSWTPTGKNNAWVALDTVANVLYLYDGSAAEWLPVSSERTLYPIVKNVAGVTLAAGTVVAVDETSPATGDKLNVVAAEGDGTKPAKLIVGVLVQSLADNSEGRAAWFGIVKGLSLPTLQPVGETWAEGDILYLSGSVNGGLTKTEPARPALDLPVAVITRISGNNLTLLVRPQLGEKLGELHDVSITGVINGQVLTYNDTTGLWVARTPTSSDGDKGEITVSSSGTVWTIDNDAVTAAKIASGAVGESELASDAVTAAKIATAAVGADEIATGAVGSDELGSSAVIETKIANDAVTSAKIANDAVGSSEIATGAVGTTEIADSAVVSAKIPASNITTEKLTTGAVTETKIATGAVTADKLGTGSVTSIKIGDSQVIESKLGTGAVTETKLGTGAVTEAKIGTDAVTAAKIAADAVGSSEIASGAVGEAELASSAVTEGKIANDAVTAAKIATGAVGADELASTAVVAGSYTAANITVDADGRITAAANGSVVTPAGSTGEIQFNNAGAFGASANLFWDNTNGRLGVGTSSPTQRLTVQGTTATDGGQLGANILSKAGWGGFGVNWTTTDTTSFTHVTGNTGTLTHSQAAVNATKYQITWTVTGRTAGTFTIAFGGYTSGNLSASGNVGPTSTSTASLVVTPTSTFNGTVTITIQVISASSPIVVYNNSAGSVAREMRITTSNTNLLDGIQAGQSITTGENNIAQGFQAGQSITTGENNIAQGFQAGRNNTTGSSWIAQGAAAGRNNTTGSSWIAQGASAGRNNTTGSSWIAQGVNAGFNNTTGSSWIAQGVNAGFNNTTGSSWIAQGESAGLNNTTGSNWIAQGLNAGRRWSDGTETNASAVPPIPAPNFTNSVYIGAETRVGGTTGTRTNENVFGYEAIGSGDNTVTLGNSSIVGHYLSGTGAVRVPTGTTAQRPTGVQGFVRYNTTTMELDLFDGTSYRRVVDIADATPNTGDVVSWTGSAFSAVASRRGIVSGTPDGSGDLTLTFGTAMPDATYSATATAEGTTAYIITVHTKATGSVKFRVFNDAGVAVTSGTITVNYQITDY